ncbi:MAG: aminotransferase class III-fold pyridoxal phosphate-dependent enzyme [Nitrospirales bacterium]
MMDASGIPRFSLRDATRLARDLYGLEAEARPLPSERDQNVRLDTAAGPAFVLKIAHADEERAVLEAQHAALDHLARTAPALHCPRIRPTGRGEHLVAVDGSPGRRHLVRLLSYVPGQLLVQVSPHSSLLLESLGTFFGRLDRALAGFAHPALKRHLEWDLQHAGTVIDRHLDAVPDRARRRLVTRWRDRYRTRVEPVLSRLRRSVIHHDGNDYNVLVTDLTATGGTVSGVVDFGDLVESCTIFEPAVCAAYALLGRTDPVHAASRVVGGYHREYPLTEDELDVLPDLLAMRLCTSVVLAAANRSRQPDNPYLTLSEGPAWAALARLEDLCPRLLTYALREACGLPPCPRSAAVVAWAAAHPEAIGLVLAPELQRGPQVVFDLQPGSGELAGVGDLRDADRWSAAMAARLAQAGATVGVGRYGEARRSYTSDAYRAAGSPVEEWRTLHLGVDLFVPARTPVFAPLEGTVHRLRHHAQLQDYGPTVVLRHEVPGVGEWFTLYGHLSEESLGGLAEGQHLVKGARLGTVGDAAVNGGWPPHVHVQVIVDLLDHPGSFPGVCAARDRALWQSLCPDPTPWLGLSAVPSTVPSPVAGRSEDDLLAARKRVLGPNLRVSYEHPIRLVHGWKQYLYDALGREYLDATNNVAHVGHGHPRVVRAAADQMAVLNTNTRYLDERLVEYAERLCATLPEPLRVCYFVCSGSEANELALRLARAASRATDVLVVEGGYHGNTTTLVDVSPYKFNGPGGRGAPPSVHVAAMPDCYRGPYRDRGDAGPRYARQVREIVDRLTREGRRVAAFLCESLISCGGQIVLPPGYLAEAYRAVREAGGVCIADEVQTGFGRVGSHFWGFQLQGVVPDIVTMGKPMGNGHPIGAVVTTPEIAAAFDTGMEYFNTFGGNPVSCAIGLAVLDVLAEEQLQAHAATVGAYVQDTLRQMMARHPVIGDVRGEGLFVGVELVRERDRREPAGREAAYVAERLKDRGILLGTDGPFRNVLKIKPPMVFTKADADRLADALDRTLAEPRLATLMAEVWRSGEAG